MIFEDLTNQRFNKLLVISYIGKVKSGQSRWLCVCDCGKVCNVVGSHLKTGNTKSCGCLKLENSGGKTHGWSNTPEYESFNSAKKRCNSKFKEKYKDWAGKGIEFRFDSFEEFIQYIGPRPEPKFDYSLDRWPNPYGHYEKGNVRWATKKQQALNRSCEFCIARNNVLEQSKILLYI